MRASIVCTYCAAQIGSSDELVIVHELFYCGECYLTNYEENKREKENHAQPPPS